MHLHFQWPNALIGSAKIVFGVEAVRIANLVAFLSESTIDLFLILWKDVDEMTRPLPIIVKPIKVRYIASSSGLKVPRYSVVGSE